MIFSVTGRKLHSFYLVEREDGSLIVAATVLGVYVYRFTVDSKQIGDKEL